MCRRLGRVGGQGRGSRTRAPGLPARPESCCARAAPGLLAPAPPGRTRACAFGQAPREPRAALRTRALSVLVWSLKNRAPRASAARRLPAAGLLPRLLEYATGTAPAHARSGPRRHVLRTRAEDGHPCRRRGAKKWHARARQVCPHPPPPSPRPRSLHTRKRAGMLSQRAEQSRVPNLGANAWLEFGKGMRKEGGRGGTTVHGVDGKSA